MIVYFDIETLPTDSEQAIQAIASTVKAPATFKKPESIAEWYSTNGKQAIEDAVGKTSFDGLYGRIACICYAFDDGEVFAAAGDTERETLEHFYSHITDAAGTPHRSGVAYQDLIFSGHNIAGFDLPFMKHRSWINGIKPPMPVYKAMNAKPWDNCIADTLLMWSSSSQHRVSMDKLCKAFGLEGKGDFDGSMVAETWPIDPQKVIEYCKDDVRRSREIYKRMTFQTAA